MSSLRRRAALAAAVTAALAIGACGLAVYAAVRAQLVADLDADLAARARALTVLVEVDDGRFEVYPAPGGDYAAERDAFFVIHGPDGAVLSRSASLAKRDLSAPAAGTIDVPTIAQSTLDGMPVRVAAASWTVRGEHDRDGALRAKIAVARSMLPLEGSLRRLAWLLTGVTAGAAIACAAALAVVMRRALVPLDRLGKRIAQLDDRTLGERLAIADAPSELAPVIERLDALLGRLDQAFARERRLGAAVAHELRTPIAGLLATIDVTTSRPRDAEAYRAALADCAAITRQMQGMIESLLLLARLEAGQVAPRLEELDLPRALRDWWAPYAERAAERKLRVVWDAPDGISVRSDTGLLRLIAANLFDNAVSHADEGGELRIACIRAGDRVCCEVANSGCTLRPDQAEQVFERFWRGDAGRGATGQHCGLGLPLCRDLARACGATIAVRIADGRFTASVELPTNAQGAK